eukprot:SAG31_NODE_12299_length_951_cov_1.075117_1_plen_72_part_00
MWLVVGVLLLYGGIDIRHYYMYAPPIWIVLGLVMTTDFCIRELGTANFLILLHHQKNLPDFAQLKSACYTM